MSDVIIIGGGIAGLAAAWRLRREAPGTRITLLEQGTRVGGVISTRRTDGYVLEEGPDLFLGAKPGAFDLAAELGIADRLHGTRRGAGGAMVLSRGRLHRLPEGLTGLIPTKMMPFVRTPLISPLGKLRVAADFLIPPRADDGDESVEAFVVRRLGREMYERIVEPLLSGIFAGDGSKLSVLATFPHMRAAEKAHGSMGAAMLAARKKGAAGHAPPPPGAAPAAKRRPDQMGFVSLPGGLGELVETLAASLTTGPDAIAVRTGAAAASVRRDGDGWEVLIDGGERLRANAVIVAAPAHAAADIVADIDDRLARELAGIRHVSSATVNIAFRRDDVPHPLDATGWTTPRIERRPLLACTWTTSKFDGRAPRGVALLRAFVGDATNQTVVQQPDDRVVATVRSELRDILGITADPVLVHLTRFAQGMPQYELGHLERVATIEARVDALAGLALAGNAYRGVGIPDVVRSADAAARRVASHLARSTPVAA